MSIQSWDTSRNPIKLRVVFLGDQGVGKSSIIDRYTTSKFDESHSSTVGIDFNLKDVPFQGRVYRLQIWDTAGQQRYRSLIPTYLKSANCVVFVCDLTKTTSLQNITNWYKMFIEHQEAPGFVVGNKSDLTSARKVSRADAEEFARGLNLAYVEVSAKLGKNIDVLFGDVLQTMVKSSLMQHEIEKSVTVNEVQNRESLTENSFKDPPVKLSRKAMLLRKIPCCQDT